MKLSRPLLAGAIALLAVACGGTTATQQPTQSASSPGSTAQAPTATTGAQPTSALPTGGQGFSTFCLNTPEEMAAALGIPAPTAVSTENPGFGGGCVYSAADGSYVYSIGVVPVTAGIDTIATGLQTPGSVAVQGVGDAAVLVSPQGPLVFRRGNWIVSSGGTPELAVASDAAAYRVAMETLARAAAGRI